MLGCAIRRPLRLAIFFWYGRERGLTRPNILRINP
jgi:hypothetical protein